MERKEEWMAFPKEFFDTLTFGELGIGDMFIRLPQPGDNRVDKGFKLSQAMFIKLRGSDAGAESGDAELLSGVAKSNKDIAMVFPNVTPVVRLV